MTYEEIRDAMNGIYAYDTGSVCSGICDESLRSAVKAHIRALPEPEHRSLLARLIINLYLSPESLAQGYGPEDAKNFLDWIDDQCLLISA